MQKFLKGMDISSLPVRLAEGAHLLDRDGSQIDLFDLLDKYNVNSIRLRIWNNPELVPESGGHCNLAETAAFARQLKEHQLHFMLDFHYSDYWADPAQQNKPHLWADLPYEDLKKAVYDYTTEVLDTLAGENALPDIVQVGNEIRSGMLFPDGEVPHYDRLAGLVNAGIQAVRDASDRYHSQIQVMIHLDQGGRFYYLKEWFDAMFDAGMLPIDCIGISFYSFWHGTFMDLRDSMMQLVERYHLPVCVVETAHPWRLDPAGHIHEEQMMTAGLPAGVEEQAKSLQLVMNIAASIPDGMGMGVYYWEPLCYASDKSDSWAVNMGIQDEQGQVLPAIEVFRGFAGADIPDLDRCMRELYANNRQQEVPAGTNLIPNGDFAQGLFGWWSEKSPKDAVSVEEREQEIYVCGSQNFHFSLFRDVLVSEPGTYQFHVDYRGTNTTGVRVQMFIRIMGCNGEQLLTKEIFPSDVDFVTHKMTDIQLDAGTVQVGIQLDAPPVFGRITNLRLTAQ